MRLNQALVDIQFLVRAAQGALHRDTSAVLPRRDSRKSLSCVMERVCMSVSFVLRKSVCRDKLCLQSHNFLGKSFAIRWCNQPVGEVGISLATVARGSFIATKDFRQIDGQPEAVADGHQGLGKKWEKTIMRTAMMSAKWRNAQWPGNASNAAGDRRDQPQPSSVPCPLSSALRPLSPVPCPLPSVLCPLSSALCPPSSALCPPSSALCPPSHSPKPYENTHPTSWPVFYARGPGTSRS